MNEWLDGDGGWVVWVGGWWVGVVVGWCGGWWWVRGEWLVGWWVGE